jgi:hypothetical protein
MDTGDDHLTLRTLLLACAISAGLWLLLVAAFVSWS